MKLKAKVKGMAIQINEKHLSPEATQALQNAKSKSQFLRDAVEFYVSKEGETSILKKEVDILKSDIKEIKNLLIEVLQQQQQPQSQKINEVVVDEPLHKESSSEKNTGAHEEGKKVERMKEKQPLKGPEKEERSSSTDDISEEQKKQIEQMLANNMIIG